MYVNFYVFQNSLKTKIKQSKKKKKKLPSVLFRCFHQLQNLDDAWHGCWRQNGLTFHLGQDQQYPEQHREYQNEIKSVLLNPPV